MKIDMQFDEKTGAWVPTVEANEPDAPQMELAQSGILGGLTKFEIADIPIGAAIGGGTLAFAVDMAFDKFLPGVSGSLGNLLAAWATQKFLSKWVGRDVARYAAIFLAYEAARNIVEPPIAKLLGGIGMSQGYRGGSMSQFNVMDQAQSVAADALGAYAGSF